MLPTVSMEASFGLLLGNKMPFTFLELSERGAAISQT